MVAQVIPFKLSQHGTVNTRWPELAYSSQVNTGRSIQGGLSWPIQVKSTPDGQNKVARVIPFKLSQHGTVNRKWFELSFQVKSTRDGQYKVAPSWPIQVKSTRDGQNKVARVVPFKLSQHGTVNTRWPELSHSS